VVEARDLESDRRLVREKRHQRGHEEHVDTILTTLTLGLDRAGARSAEVVLGETTKDLLTTIESVAAAPGPEVERRQAVRRGATRAPQSATAKFAQEAGNLKPWTPTRLARGPSPGQASSVRRRTPPRAVLGEEAKGHGDARSHLPGAPWDSTRTTVPQQTP
jgi:hypothetical protein